MNYYQGVLYSGAQFKEVASDKLHFYKYICLREKINTPTRKEIPLTLDSNGIKSIYGFQFNNNSIMIPAPSELYCYEISIPDNAQIYHVQGFGCAINMLDFEKEVDEQWYIDNLQNNPFLLKNIKNQTPEMCALAVSISCKAMRYITCDVSTLDWFAPFQTAMQLIDKSLKEKKKRKRNKNNNLHVETSESRDKYQKIEDIEIITP